MRHKGFTLIELLAVIVILAIIMVIAIPSILSVIANAKKGAFESDAKLVANAIENKAAIDESFDWKSINKDSMSTILGLSNSNYDSVTVLNNNNEINLIIVGKNKWDGYTTYGSFKDMHVVKNTENGSPVLSSLTTSVGTLTFDSNTFTYNLTVPLDATSINITPTIGDANSIIDVNGDIQNSGEPYAYTFATGESLVTLNVRVTSITGNTDKSNTYTINISKGANTNLSSLVLKVGSTTNDLSQGFDPNITSYTATIDAEVATVVVIPSASDATNATLRVNGVVTQTGAQSQPISIPFGGSVTIITQVSNGGSSKQYGITVTRVNNYIGSIAVTATIGRNTLTYPVSPTISRTDSTYSANTSTATSATVAVTGEDATNVNVYINSTLGTSVSVPLNIVGVNAIPISIVSKTGNIARNYTLNITRTG